MHEAGRWGAAVTGAAVAAGAVLVGAPLLGLAIGVAAPVCLAIWLRPQVGLLLLAALLPFDGLLLVLPLPGVAAGWKEALLGFTLVAALQPRHGPYRPPPVVVVPLALLLTVALVTATQVPALQAVVGVKVTFFGMLTAVVLWRCPFDLRERDRLVSVLAGVGAAVSVVGLAQQGIGAARLHELGYAYNTTIRFTGGVMRSWSTFNQPFPFAFFLMLVVLVTGAVALADLRRLRNRFVLAAMPLYLAGMAVAVVRTAWIGVVAGLVYLALARYRGLLAALPVVLGGLVLAGAVGAAGFFASDSVDERLGRWTQLVPAVESAPLGKGIGSAGAAAAKATELAGGTASFDPARAQVGRLVFQPDNSYLKVLYELGVLGLGVFVVLLVVAFVDTRRHEHDPDDDGFAVGASALVVAAAVASTASTFFEIFPLDYLFWLVVAAVLVPSAGSRRVGTTTSGSVPVVSS